MTNAIDAIVNFMSEYSWITPFVFFVFMAVFLMLVVLFMVLLERRFLALLTVRYGPNRVGFQGVLQTVADAIKLLCKEDVRPRASLKALFFIAPLLMFCPIFMIYFLVPFSNNFIGLNSSVGLILFCAVSSIATLGIFLGGYASNNKYSIMGAFRAVSQAIAYEIPLLMCILSVAILAGTFNLNEIVKSQSGGIFNWFFLPLLVGFLVFFIGMLAELNRAPFDLPEGESELVGGYHTEYSGMKFAMFFLGEYALLFILPAFFVTIFLGGYQTPLPFWILPEHLLFIEQIFWLFLKTFAVILFIILIRATLPRLRMDKLLDLSFKVLIPLSILNLIIATIFVYVRNIL